MYVGTLAYAHSSIIFQSGKIYQIPIMWAYTDLKVWNHFSRLGESFPQSSVVLHLSGPRKSWKLENA